MRESAFWKNSLEKPQTSLCYLSTIWFLSKSKNLSCFRNKHLHPVDISHQHEWEEVELLLLKHSWGWDEGVSLGCWVSPSSVCEIAAFSLHRVWGQMEGWLWEIDLSLDLFVNRERPVSSCWLHPTANVGFLMGSYQQVLHHSSTSWEEERVLGQTADRCPPRAQTENGQRRDNWNQLVYGQREMFYVVMV